MSAVDESLMEHVVLTWLASLGYVTRPGPRITPGQPDAERK